MQGPQGEATRSGLRHQVPLRGQPRRSHGFDEFRQTWQIKDEGPLITEPQVTQLFDEKGNHIGVMITDTHGNERAIFDK